MPRVRMLGTVVHGDVVRSHTPTYSCAGAGGGGATVISLVVCFLTPAECGCGAGYAVGLGQR